MNKNYLIILLNYNNCEDTIECINSLKNSDVSSSNILVIENCSIDNSIEILEKEASDIKVLRMNKNLGFTGGNNVGIKYALENNFEYAILLNNDTIVESKDTFRMLISEMDKNKDITIGTGRILYYPQKELIWYDGGALLKLRASAVHFNYKKNMNDIMPNNNLKRIDFISGCYMCIRLADVAKLGYMNENIFIYLDDIEYSARAMKKGLKLLYVPEAVIYHKAMGEEKRTPKRLYYSIRNRRLLINLHFGLVSKIYFESVLIIKRFYWLITNKQYHNILVYASEDFKKGYFGQAPDYIK